MKLIIDISEYDREWIKNTYGIPQDIDVAIARAIINGKKLPDHHGRLVDADTIVTAMNDMKVEGEVFVTAVNYVKLIMNDADTIVEAEGEK